ncbi:MAG TPA: SGNH/GDSL hydrolase family protein [Hyphomonas sp.]|nr:SGNH/GDSL hydrolase family protein [Hyphomonas sp.]HRX73937.1 SGNH/GDSL hydrolase family protein [Hyphomonas sp.]
MGSVAEASPEPATGKQFSFLNRWGPRALVILGAIATFAAFGDNYFSGAESFSRQAKLEVAGCGALMGLGILWEVIIGQRSLAETVRFWSVVALVGITTWAMRIYEIESTAFYKFIAPLTLCGFIVNHYLPASMRRPFFLGLGLVAIIGIFGVASIPAAAGLVGASLVLIGVCHLPVSIWIRLGILFACTALLAAFRLGWHYTGWIAAVLPILAAMFMFRLSIYLYDISNGKGPKDWSGRLAYFFLFPNFVFPFFPAVDFSAFGRSYYNDEPTRIYRHGATYILRGFVHLLLYRLIHLDFVMLMTDVSTPLDFLQYIVSNFGLYLRVSGLFHLIVGLIVLFGYNLPETHSRFYFSNSFIDFWRRINIYWKDYMQKMVFNPSYMVFKKWGVPHMTGVMLAIATVFFATWALHAYQWFWLTGTVLFSAPDVLFWVILGALLIGQTWLEARPKTGKVSPHAFVPPKVALVIRTVSTFIFICLLWSFWTSPTAAGWVDMIAQSGLAPAFDDLGAATASQWAVTLLFMAGVLLLAAITMGIDFGLFKPAPRAKRTLAKKKDFYGAVALCGAIAVGLIALQAPQVNRPAHLTKLASDIGARHLNEADQAMLERGYYEGLISSQRFNGELWEFFMTNPGKDRGLAKDYPGVHFIDSYMEREFVPGADYTAADITTRINEWGMDDEPYTLAKPANTYRIAVLGASRTRGWGVTRDERFTTLIRNDLYKDAKDTGERFEVMNFASDGEVAAQRLMQYEQSVERFHPHLVIFVAGVRDTNFDHHARMVRRGTPMPYPFLDEINAKAGINASMTETEIIRRLEPYKLEYAGKVYELLAEKLRQDGVPGLWIYVPAVSDDSREGGDHIVKLEAAAKAAGFHTLNLSSIFEEQADRDSFRISRWDSHPNGKGHRLLADAIMKYLEQLKADGTIDMDVAADSIQDTVPADTPAPPGP